MAYNPISGFTLQVITQAGEIASDYYLKFYEANTTTPLSMATDSTGGTLLVKAKLSDAGFPISNPLDNSTVFIPHMNANYRLVVYLNEADADANDTASAYVNIPSVSTLVGASAIGTVAALDTGTAAGEVPTNADLLFALLGTAEKSTNTYTFTPLSGVFPALITGMVVSFSLPSGSITGAALLDYDGTTKDIRWIDTTALVSGDIDTTYNKEIILKYDGTQWVIISALTGSNSNGKWYRQPCGLQTCTDQGLSKATNDTLTFAKSFADTIYTISYATAEDADRIMNAGSVSKTTSGISKLRIQNTSAGFVTATAMEYTAIGRWY